MHSYELSYWEREAFFTNIDFLIVGGGIVGLSAAIAIKEKEPTAKVTIIDRGTLPIGASTRNAGFACFGSMTELLDDLQSSSEEEVFKLVEQRFKGLQKLKKRYGEKQLGYYGFGGYEIFRAEETKVFEQCMSKKAGINQLLKAITGLEETFVQPAKSASEFGLKKIDQMLLNRAEGQLNTGMLMATLLRQARKLDIHFMGGITVSDWEEDADIVNVRTEKNWCFKAKYLLLATNGFAKKLLPDWDVQPARNQVLITKPIPKLKLKGTFHYNQGYYYFRNIDGRVLLGGGRNLDKNAETTPILGSHKEIREALIKLLEDLILPNQNYEVDQWWSGIMGVGNQKSPLVQAIGRRSAAAVRLGGMGVALGTEVGEMGANLIVG